MKFDKYVKDNYVVYLANEINSEVKAFVRFDENEDAINKIENNQCIIVIKPEKVDEISNIMYEVENMIMQIKRKDVNSDVVILSNNAIDVQKYDDDRFKFIVQSDTFLNEKDNKEKNDRQEEPFEKFWRINLIKKEDNGVFKSYIQRKGDSNNIGYLVDLDYIKKEDLFLKFKEMTSDNTFMDRISHMKEEEIANLLLDSIVDEKGIKKYYLESNDKQKAFDERGNIASNVATTNDGVVNKEIGVVQNSPSVSNAVNTVEKKNDNYRVVAPEVTTHGTATNDDASSYSFDMSNQYASSLNVNTDNVDNNYDNEEERQKQEREDLTRGHLNSKANVKRLVRTPTYMDHSSGFVSVVGISVIFIILFLFILFAVI